MTNTVRKTALFILMTMLMASFAAPSALAWRSYHHRHYHKTTVAKKSVKKVAAKPKKAPVAPLKADLNVVVGETYEIQAQGVTMAIAGASHILAAEVAADGVRLTGKRTGASVVIYYDASGSHRVVAKVIAAPVAKTPAPVPQVPQVPSLVASVAPVIASAPAAPAAAVVPSVESAPRRVVMLKGNEIRLQAGESDVIKGKKIYRASVSDPNVVDIVPVSVRELLVNAKADGISTIKIWDSGKTSTYSVRVGKTPEELAESIRKELGAESITVRVSGDSIILAGKAPTLDASSKAAAIAQTYGRKVLNLITVESVSPSSIIESLKSVIPDQPLSYEVLADHTVLIKGTVASIEECYKIRDLLKTWIATPEQGMDDAAKPQDASQQATADSITGTTSDSGIAVARESKPGNVTVGEEYSFTRKVFGGRVQNGPRMLAIIDINPSLAKQILVGVQILEVDKGKLDQFGLQWASFDSGIATPLFTLTETPSTTSLNPGPLSRNGVSALVKALTNENAAKLLSSPNVLIADGHTANILVGGEFPIPVAQSTTGTVTIEFKTYGIQLAVRPQTTPDDRILLTLTPEVSQLDFTNSIRTASIDIPSIKVRRATTTVHMDRGQSLAIGGLLSSEDAKSVDRVPILSDIPIIGELFKSNKFTKNQTELIILVTPRIVENGKQAPINNPMAQNEEKK